MAAISNDCSTNANSNSLKIYLEDGEIIIQGSIDLGYIGLFDDSQIDIETSLEEIREWDIVEENLDEDCSDDELIDFLNEYYNRFIKKIEKNIEKYGTRSYKIRLKPKR